MAWDPALEAVLLGRLKRTTDSAPGPARRKDVDSAAGPGLVAWGEPRSNSTNYYDGIVNPTGGNLNQSDVDWTRLAACQDLAPHGGAEPRRGLLQLLL
jgi:hypothetical protein